MGMSASQARLLSITSRLTNNEFRSQTITNSKLRLAQESESASAEYMDALNTQQLMFGSYSSDGKYTTTALTPALIYDYAPLKNQYALVNPSGKVLVSNVDAKNYENSKDLYDFLDKYGLIGNSKTYEQYLEDDKYYNEVAIPYYNRMLERYLENKDKQDLYTPFSSIVGTSDDPKFCYQTARSDDESASKCFLHLLNYLIDYQGNNKLEKLNLTTSTGKSFYSSVEDGDKTKLGDEVHNSTEVDETFVNISKNLGDAKCDGFDDENYKTLNKAESNLLASKKANGEEITELDKLRSDYIDNGDGTYSLKTLKQKAIDMYYIILKQKDFNISNNDMRDMLDNFTDGDMKNLTNAKPEPPAQPVKPNFNMSLTDKDKAQWYVNLWYMMNGSDSANKVRTNQITYGTLEETVHSVENSAKNSAKPNYQVFEDMNLYKSSEWLQFALEHGMVTMYQAQYSNPSANNGKVSEVTSEGITWKSIIYTNASDITSQDNETAIAIAEVKYKNAITEIENKDKKYDQDLKKLDTEHSALQTEYESIKEVISKNTERSFKAFS